jgi:hypothetical protein
LYNANVTGLAPVDANVSLLVCPFCGGEAEYTTESVRSGYGEYESIEKYHVVTCKTCKCNGRRYHQKHLINFTSYTVSDFRNNPLLRAKVEDEYESYCQQTKQLAVDAWNKRANAVLYDKKYE